MRSYVLAGNTGHYDGVIAALEARGLKVIPAFASDAPCSKLRPSGIVASIVAGATTNVAQEPKTPVQHTLVPTGMATSGAASTTVPAPSSPAGYGNGNRTAYVPDLTSGSA